MARYIDADKFEKYILERYNTMEMVGINQVVNFIHEQPTADVKEVVRGEWIDVDGNDECYKCSICNKTINGNGIPYYFNFCHKCGADMREGVK